MSASSADTLPPPRQALLVVGRGRMGTAVARAAAQAGVEVVTAGREDLAECAREAEVALLCVPDSAITNACEDLVSAAPSIGHVGHTSGATGLDALAPAAQADAGTFSLHPLQTVPDGSSALVGAPAAVAGSDPASLELARDLARRLGMEPFEVPEEARAAYHAAASIASNFLIALESSAVELLDAAGIENGRELLAPLVLRTVANWAESGPEALTGPIARGDEETVRRHLEAVAEHHPELEDLYRALAARTRAVAATREAART